MTRDRDFLYRKGKYIYFRHPKTKQLTPLPRDERSAEFEAAYGPLYRAVKGANDPEPAPLAPPLVTARESRFEPGMVGYFVEEYLVAPKFLKLKPNTQACYRRDLDRIRGHRIGASMLHDATPQGIDIFSAEMAKAHGGATADAITGLISNLWNLARGYECFRRGDKHNPTIGRLRHYEGDEDGHLVWPDEVIDKFDGWSEPHLVEYRMGLHYTGQRGGDVLMMRWTDYRRGKIHVMQEKTGERIWVHCPAKLKALLDRMLAEREAGHKRRQSAFIFTNLRGRPFASASSLSTCMKFQLVRCGYKGLYTMHGLRKNAGMELALAGCTVNEIMSVLGHKSPKMAIFYCKQADKVRLAEAATAKLDAFHAAEDARRAEEKQEMVGKRRSQLKVVGEGTSGTRKNSV